MEDITYESAIKRLEEIVSKLETGNASLEDSMKLFEEANKLAIYCKNKLDTAEQTIIRLTSEGNEEQVDGDE